LLLLLLLLLFGVELFLARPRLHDRRGLVTGGIDGVDGVNGDIDGGGGGGGKT